MENISEDISKIHTNIQNIMSDYTVEEFLQKQIEEIYYYVQKFVHYYHIEGNFITLGKDIVSAEVNWKYNLAYNRIKYITPVLEDFIDDRLSGFEDILIAIYGIMSDEVFVFREYLNLEQEKRNCNGFVIDHMGCLKNGRMYNILTGNIIK